MSNLEFYRRSVEASLTELRLARRQANEEKQALEQLRKRKQIIKIEIKRIKKANLTDIGKKLISIGVRDEKFVDTITPQTLRTGEWKNKTFRRYDVTINVPST